jgi:uncharacterized membrane protein
MNFAAFLKYFKLVFQVISLVQAALPSEPASVKKAVAMVMIDPPVEDVPAVEGLVDKLVKAAKMAGVWVSGQPPVTPPTV